MCLIAAGKLLERERELDALQRAIDSAVLGVGSAVMIEGDAGIGKTALLASCSDLALTAGMTLLSARAGELEHEFAWGVVRQLFDRAVARAPSPDRARLLDGAAALAAPALGIEAAPEGGDVSYATLHGLYWLTVNICQDRPVLLAIDDLHWADDPSLRFIAHVLPRIAGLPILLVATSRAVGTERIRGVELLAGITVQAALTSLKPDALSPAATARLVRTQLQDDVSDDVCGACYEVSTGNPFLLWSLLAELAGEDREHTELGAEHVRRITPAVVSASVLLRLARLAGGVVPLARAVAILGAGASPHTAGRLAGLGVNDAAQAAGDLIRAGILIDDDGLTFTHPLVRTAVYGDLAGPERSAWHRRAARLLADDGAGIDRIGTHLMQSSPAGDAWTVALLRRGAADAAARGAPDVAADYLRRALAEPPEDQLRGEVLYELGQTELAYDPAAAARELREALDRGADRYLRPEMALALGGALTLLGSLRDAIEVFDAGCAELPDEDESKLRASLEAARLGAARWEPTAQVRRHELADDMRRRATAGRVVDPRLHTQLAIEAAAEGIDRERAVHHARAALSAAEHPSAGATSALPEAMLVLAFADLGGEAAAAVDEWLTVARAHARPLAVVLGATVATLGCLYRGAVREAIGHSLDAVAVTSGAQIQLAPITVAFLVEALTEGGDVDQASTVLAQRGLDGELPYAWATTPLLLARGRLRAAAGDYAKALEDLIESGRRAEAWAVRNPAMHPWRSSAAVPLARVGDRDRATALAEEEVKLARCWGTPRTIGVALRAGGIANGGEHGMALLRESVAILHTSTAPLEYARAVTDLGSALRRSGARAEARDHLRAGLDLAHRLGALHLAARARDELTIAGGRPRRDALRGRDALTPSELRVAQLAADGLANREIAEQLFITLRTVEAHLTSTYSKLEIASRQQLAGSLASSTN